MADSKERLKSMIAGISADRPARQPETDKPEGADLAQTIAAELELTKEQEAKLYELRTRKLGRPKGSPNGKVTPREARATFIVDRDITRKLKYIALMDTRLYKNVIAEALGEYISKWEGEHGKINLKKQEL